MRNGVHLTSALAEEYIGHHLRLFGYEQVDSVRVFNGHSNSDWLSVEKALRYGDTVLLIAPSASLCANLNLVMRLVSEGPFTFHYEGKERKPWSRLRSLGRVFAYTPLIQEAGSCWQNLARTEGGETVWIGRAMYAGWLIVCGSDVARDLLLYRQGDPERAAIGQQGDRWGFEFERPNYLFEELRKGEPALERHADYLAMALAKSLANLTNRILAAMLPGGACGAVVLTGDDDQAFLEKYTEQLRLIGKTPITYFLHPQTRHDGSSLRRMQSRKRIDIELHPDALDRPSEYAALLAEQCSWFEELTGRRARAVRNHGFLNSGYWGHLSAWLEQGIEVSSNLPGRDGTALNGSYLPARVVFDGVLTRHWSILTTFGDGWAIRFAENDDVVRSRIAEVGKQLRSDGIPGVLVFNLHPQNVDESKAMCEAALTLVREGFIAWNLQDCIDWFRRLDEGAPQTLLKEPRYPFQRLLWRLAKRVSSMKKREHSCQLKVVR